MSQLNDCNDVQVRWIHKYLHLIKKLTSNGENENIEDISVENLIFASSNLNIIKSALSLTEDFRGNKKEFNKSKFIDDIKACDKNLNTDFSIINSSHNFETAIDSEFLNPICDNKGLVIERVKEGINLINIISSEWKEKIEKAIHSVSGLFDEHNIINSGFTKDFPGFISLNINADFSIIGEEIAHESTHLLFDNLLYFNSDIREKIKKIPPVYSIFAKKPRSIELVLHGLFSYTSVYVFWKNLAQIYPDEQSRSKNRTEKVFKYIKAALQSLSNVLNHQQWKEIKNIYKTICPVFEDDLWNIKIYKKKISIKSINKLKDNFSNIESAEILLAIEKNKVSRISKPIAQINSIINIIEELPVFYCFSDYLFSSNEDKSINDFHNVISETYSLYNLDSYINYDLSVHIYFSSNQKELIDAFSLDKEDNCGKLFKTPSCCEKHFKNKWDYAVQYLEGDMTKLYFENLKEDKILNNLQYNPIPMYFDLGFCWHFPCDLECEATKKVINERIKILKKYPLLFKELETLEKYQLYIDKRLNYRLLRY